MVDLLYFYAFSTVMTLVVGLILYADAYSDVNQRIGARIILFFPISFAAIVLWFLVKIITNIGKIVKELVETADLTGKS